MTTACTHPVRDDRGVCTACGDCIHDVILNGACVYCGATDIDPKKVSPRTDPIVPADRLRRK
jgi:hypothetical protein